MVTKSNLQIDSFITPQTSERFWLVNVCVCLQSPTEQRGEHTQRAEFRTSLTSILLGGVCGVCVSVSG